MEISTLMFNVAEGNFRVFSTVFLRDVKAANLTLARFYVSYLDRDCTNFVCVCGGGGSRTIAANFAVCVVRMQRRPAPTQKMNQSIYDCT